MWQPLNSCEHSQHLKHVLVLSAKEDSSTAEVRKWLQLRWACHVSTAHSSDQQLSIAHQTKSILWLPLLHVGYCWMVTEPDQAAKRVSRRTVLSSLLWALSYVPWPRAQFRALSSFLFSCFAIKVMFSRQRLCKTNTCCTDSAQSFCWLLYLWDAFWRRRNNCVYIDTNTHTLYIYVYMCTYATRMWYWTSPSWGQTNQTCPGILFRFLWWYPPSAQTQLRLSAIPQQHSTVHLGKVETKPTQRHSWL